MGKYTHGMCTYRAQYVSERYPRLGNRSFRFRFVQTGTLAIAIFVFRIGWHGQQCRTVFRIVHTVAGVGTVTVHGAHVGGRRNETRWLATGVREQTTATDGSVTVGTSNYGKQRRSTKRHGELARHTPGAELTCWNMTE